jgi:PEP-CTERM motif
MKNKLFIPDIAHAARCVPLLLSACWVPAVVQAGPVGIDDVSSVYTQNFDSLSGSYSLLRPYVNGTTLAGWYLFNGTGAAVSSVNPDSGTAIQSAIYHYGTSTDRALGARPLASSQGGFVGYLALAMTNNTGADIAAFDLSYDGEEWRSGGQNRSTAITVGHRKGAAYSNTGWTTTSSAFTFTSPVVNGTESALDGNAAANRRSGRGGTVTTNWAAGETLWLRFAIAPSGLGGDNAVAIDNVNLSFTPATTTPPGGDVPEPGSLALVAAGLAAAWARSRR